MNRTADENMESWSLAVRPDVSEYAVPSIALLRPDLFPLPDAGVLNFTDPDTFSKCNALDYLRGVHSVRLRSQFLKVANGNCDATGQLHPSIFDDPRLNSKQITYPNHKIPDRRIGVAKVNDVLTLHLPNITLPPSVAGYRMGQTTARLAEGIRDKKGEATVFEMGVGGGIIMSSALRNFRGQGLFYVGGDVDDLCLRATDISMQMNGFDHEKYRLEQGCILDPIRTTGTDVIVSNPPYYPSRVAGKLSKKVGPQLSTDGGDDGLDFYKAIFRDSAGGILNPGGRILLQVPNQNLHHVQELAKDAFGVSAKVTVAIEPSSKEKGVLVELI